MGCVTIEETDGGVQLAPLTGSRKHLLMRLYESVRVGRHPALALGGVCSEPSARGNHQ